MQRNQPTPKGTAESVGALHRAPFSFKGAWTAALYTQASICPGWLPLLCDRKPYHPVGFERRRKPQLPDAMSCCGASPAPRLGLGAPPRQSRPQRREPWPRQGKERPRSIQKPPEADIGPGGRGRGRAAPGEGLRGSRAAMAWLGHTLPTRLHRAGRRKCGWGRAAEAASAPHTLRGESAEAPQGPGKTHLPPSLPLFPPPLRRVARPNLPARLRAALPTSERADAAWWAWPGAAGAAPWDAPGRAPRGRWW